MPKKIELPKLSRMSKKEQLLAVATVLVVALLLLDRVVLSPWIRHLGKLREEIRRLEETHIGYQRLLGLGDRVRADAEILKPYLKPGAASDLQMAGMLKEIEGMARQSQISLEGIKPLPGDETDLIQSYAFEVQFQSFLPQWIRFLHLIETSPSLFEVERASLDIEDEKPGLMSGYLRLKGVVMRDATQDSQSHVQ
ncbi:MAG: hypothetical protein HY594_01915 [Candidatus Omnitrophica bacterium]|nr:hypothetical protein [Candidatus Omnitrophota bacterium]